MAFHFQFVRRGIDNFNNYRAVTLQCTPYKILTNTLYVKLVSYADKITGQCEGGI